MTKAVWPLANVDFFLDLGWEIVISHSKAMFYQVFFGGPLATRLGTCPHFSTTKSAYPSGRGGRPTSQPSSRRSFLPSPTIFLSNGAFSRLLEANAPSFQTKVSAFSIHGARYRHFCKPASPCSCTLCFVVVIGYRMKKIFSGF